MKNYYRILGLGIDAENEEIKAAYRILAQRHHPDKGGTQAEFILIQEAFSILSNPLTKRSYDQQLYRSFPAKPANLAAKGRQDWWWLCLLGLFSCGAMVFAAWVYHKTQTNGQVLTAIAATKTTSNPVPIHHHSAALSGPKRVASAQLVSQLADLSGRQYLINVGSFTTLTAAKNRQAQLKEQGLNSTIQAIAANSEGLASYNLFIGPYQNSDNAEKMLNLLESKNIDATLEKVDFD